MGIERLPTPQQAIGDRNKYRAIRLSNGIEALLIEGEKKLLEYVSLCLKMFCDF